MAGSKTEGYAAGAAADRIVEGSPLVRLHGPEGPDDSPKFPVDNDFDDTATARPFGYAAASDKPAPNSPSQDSIG